MKKITYLPIISIILFFAVSSMQAQQRERIIAITNYTTIPMPHDSGYFAPIDSYAYTYIGYRLVDSMDAFNYPDSQYIYHHTAGTGYVPTTFRKCVYTPFSKVLADSAWTWDTGTQSYIRAGYDHIDYDSNQLQTYELGQRWDAATQSYVNGGEAFFLSRADGQPVYQIYTTWDTTAYDTTFSNTYTYDAQGRQASYTSRYYHNNVPHTFTTYFSYDSQGRIDSSLMAPSALTVDSYDASGYLSVELSEVWDTTYWRTTGRTVYSYDSLHQHLTSIQMNSDGNGGWVNARRYQATFDSYRNRTWYATNSWDTATHSWYVSGNDHEVYYYYEVYTPDTIPSGIAQIAPAGEVRIYPVPAADMLSLDLQWTEAQAATATIYDLSGRKQSQWTLPNTATYHGYIPVSQLAGGAYTLSIKGTSGGSISRTFTIAK